MRFRAALSVSATLAALYACGETLGASGDEPDGGTEGTTGSDGGGGADGSGDGSTTPGDGGCDRSSAFGPAVEVPIDGAYSIEAARFNDDRTVGYVALCPADGNKTLCDLYQSPYNAGRFSSHVKLTSVSSSTYDSYPSVTADGKFLVFASRADGGSVRIQIAAAINASFDTALPKERTFAGVNLASMNEPYVLGSGKALYFGGMTASYEWNIYRATGWENLATPAPATMVAELDANGNQMAPVVTDDEDEIFFASNRLTPNDAENGLDIHRARRGVDGKFAAPEVLSSLNASGNDWPVWISPDHCDLYFINKDPSTKVATLRVASRR